MKKNILLGILILIAFGYMVNAMSQIATPNVTQKTLEPAPVATEEVKRRDVLVSFQNVKLVDGKYRYFFDIRNNDPEPIEAKVKIELLKQNGSVIGRNEFAPSKPLEPGYGDSVYFDINTGITPEFDPEYAVVGFRYEVREAGKVVASGNAELGL